MKTKKSINVLILVYWLIIIGIIVPIFLVGITEIIISAMFQNSFLFFDPNLTIILYSGSVLVTKRQLSYKKMYRYVKERKKSQMALHYELIDQTQSPPNIEGAFFFLWIAKHQRISNN